MFDMYMQGQSVDPRRPDPLVHEPLSAIRARSLYTPDPKASDLARATAGPGARRPGTVKIEFCVGPLGNVTGTKVARSFGGDLGVDRVCRDAVKRWRFKPARVDGKTRTTCSEVSFEIRFDD